MHRAANRFLALLAVCLVLAAGLSTSSAEPPPPTPTYEANEGPVFLIISFDPEFAFVHPGASETIMVNIGSLIGGSDVLDTRFIVNEALTGVTLPDGRRDPTFEELAAQQSVATVLGSFYALDGQGFHSVVPEPGVVPLDIQEAVFQASNFGALDDLIAKKEFPTTKEIVDTIADYLPAGTPYGAQDIDDHVFGSTTLLSVAADGSLEGDMELFPHEPYSPSIFTLEFGLDKDGGYRQAVSQQIPIKIQSPINFSDRSGMLPVTIESGRGFDANDIDIESLTIDGVEVDVAQSAVNGNDALIAKFSVAALVAAGVLTETTTELTIRGTYTLDASEGGYTLDWFGVDTVTVQ